MYVVTATIGRNVTTIVHNLDGTITHQQDAMSVNRWHGFKGAVQSALVNSVRTASTIVRVDVHEGPGGWDGVAEDAATIVMLIEDRDELSDAVLHTGLRLVATSYEQEAIALVVSESVLITPAIDPRSHWYPRAVELSPYERSAHRTWCVIFEDGSKTCDCQSIDAI